MRKEIAEIIEESRKMFIADTRKKLQTSFLVFFDVINNPVIENKAVIENFFHAVKGTAYTLNFKSMADTAKMCEEIIRESTDTDKLDNNTALNILNGFSAIWNEVNTYYEYYFGEMEKQPVNRKGLMNPLFKQITAKSNLVERPGSNILLVDEDIITVDFLKKKFVKSGYNVFCADKHDEVFSIIARKRIDIIIMDVLLSGKNGFEMYKSIKENGYEGMFIFLTEKNLVQDKVNALKLGVDDYIIKPFNFSELLVRIQKLSHLRFMQCEKNVYDSLTGAYTREYFYQNIKSDMHKLDKSKRCFSLVLVDLDDFALVNKCNGFLIGDMILKKFVEMVKEILDTDKVFRFDGDKFLIFLDNIEDEKALSLVNKLSEEIAAAQFANLHGSLGFSGSIYTVTNSKTAIEKIIDRLYEVIIRIKNSVKGKILLVPSESVEAVKKPKILIADDAEAIKHMVKPRLEALDCKLYYAADGVEAVEKCKDLKPEILILDLMMPKMDGFQVCSVLKNDPNLKDIRIIIISSRNKEEDVRKCFKLGVDGYMLKPFSIEELEFRVKKLLHR